MRRRQFLYPFTSGDGKLHGICCARLPQRYLLLVNATSEKIETEGVISGAEDVSKGFHDFFQKRGDVLPVKSGKFRITLGPHETCVYWSE
jgi:hypothetical protein